LPSSLLLKAIAACDTCVLASYCITVLWMTLSMNLVVLFSGAVLGEG